MEEPLYAQVDRSKKAFPRRYRCAMAADATLDMSNAIPIPYNEFVSHLEYIYGGKDRSHGAAAVIQRAFRAFQLQKQFSKLLSLAMSTERIDKRLSLLTI